MSAATMDQVRALLDAKLRRDDARFWNIGAQIVARLKTSESPRAAEFELLVERGRAAMPGASSSVAPAVMQMTELPRHGGDPVCFETATEQRDALLLHEAAAGLVDTFLLEQRCADKLLAAGFAPSRRLMLVGPPGTGKTLTARVIARELGLPLGLLKMHVLVDSYLGETAKQLAKVFARVAQTRAVYLFDEIDAVAPQRQKTKDSSDGEIHRTVNALLTMLDDDRSDSIIIGATNLANHLDHALVRRFDSVIHYQYPSAEHAREMIRAKLARVPQGKIDWNEIGHLATQISYSDVELIARTIGRACVLSEKPVMTKMIVEQIIRRATDSKIHV